MSHDQKTSLREEVDRCVPKEASELLAMHHEELNEDLESDNNIEREDTKVEEITSSIHVSIHQVLFY
jgi:hypothetical protein